MRIIALRIVVLAGVLGSRELVRLFPESHRPSEPFVVCGVLLLLVANWYPTIRLLFSPAPVSVWPVLVAAFVAVLLGTFLLEMRRYNGEPGAAVTAA